MAPIPLMEDGAGQSCARCSRPPEAEVYLVATGTTANALALATLAQPWETIFCTPTSPISTKTNATHPNSTLAAQN